MEGLDALKDSLENLRDKIAAKRAERQGYLDKAAEIEEIYNRMDEDKDLIKSYKKSVKTFLSEEYDTFVGILYKDTYKVQLEALIEDYDTVIENIDINMDRLNTERAKYENKANNLDGPIGYLKSAINSVTHSIQNWVN